MPDLRDQSREELEQLVRNLRNQLKGLKQLDDQLCLICTGVSRAGEAVEITDREGRLLYVNPAFERLTGYSQIEAIGRTPKELLRSVEGAGQTVEMRGILEQGQVCRTEMVCRHKDGTQLNLLISVAPIIQQETLIGFVAIRRDCSRIKLAEQTLKQLTELTELDPLTELQNRRGLERALANLYARAQRGGERMVSLLIDCDNFKQINDQYGHAVGDVTLREISARLKSTLRKSDQLARIGGDEFLVLLPDTRLAEAQRVADKLTRVISSRAFMMLGEPLHTSISVAVIKMPLEPCSLEEILALGHRWLRAAKNGDRSVVDQASHERLVSLLTSAGGLRVFSQPIIDLNSNRQFGQELLIRGPEGDDYEMPDALFNACRRLEMLALADLAAARACLGAAATSTAPGRLHLNIFPSTLHQIPIEQLLKLFEPYPKDRFCIEISEQDLIGDPGSVRQPVTILREAGLSIAIEDVGFGRSSLEALILLEPQIVKIDRLWVNGLATDPSKKTCLERLVRVAKALDATVIAEGVQTEADLSCIKRLGVRYAQGFIWARPQLFN